MMKALSLTQPIRTNTLRICQSGFSTTAHALAEQPKPERPQIGASSLFEDIQHEAEEKLAVTEHKPVNKEYKFSSTNFRTSPRKLNMLARQIRNLPVEEAIKQMEFSDKRSAKKILHNLAFATKNATEQKEMKDLVVSQAWVGKGRFITRPNYHGRGQFGLKQSKEAHISFILKEKEAVEKSKEDRRSIRGWKESNKTWTQLNETKPIYNPKPFYNW